ncbi:hypothetical protein [Cellulomonas sp. C5510]|nr:hypothetical protein [Cellulomonas sp. C5510]
MTRTSRLRLRDILRAIEAIARAEATGRRHDTDPELAGGDHS